MSEDVILEFQKSFEKKYWDSLFYIKENGKYQLNLWEANRLITVSYTHLMHKKQMTGSSFTGAVCFCVYEFFVKGG